MSATQADPPRRVAVALGARGYDILIGPGLLERAPAQLESLARTRRVAVVSDETVGALHLPRLASALEAAGFRVARVLVPAGERSKGFAELERVVDALLEARIERGDLVLALGGGVVGDLAGFAAAILRRGVRVVQMPTTLLAQVDSSVGGKTGINTRHGKNLVGAFHQPSLVLVDPALLDTLPPREFRAGYAEIAKAGLLGDADFFSWLEAHRPQVFAGGSEREHAIQHSCAMKAAIVAEDETETGRRALLNLGHTFGHALEAAAGYGERLLHGEAVAIGLRLAFAFSARLGLVGADRVDRVARHLADVGLPSRIQDIEGLEVDAERLMRLIAQDKKVAGGALTFILARDIGDAFVASDVPPDQVRAFLEAEMRATDLSPAD